MNGDVVYAQIVLIDATVEFFNYGLSSSVAPSLGNLNPAAAGG